MLDLLNPQMSFPQVLAEPMLSAVSKEAEGAAEAGWFWRIRPLRCKVRRRTISCLVDFY